MCTGNVGVAVLDPSYCEGSDLALGQFQNKKRKIKLNKYFVQTKILGISIKKKNLTYCIIKIFESVKKKFRTGINQNKKSDELLNILGGSCPKGRLSEQKKSCGG